MNYDEARQLKDGGWHWTTMNNGQVRATAPCFRHVGDESDPMWYLHSSKPEEWETCAPHETQADAERHFYEYCIEQLSEHTWNSAHLCEGPHGEEVWTNKTLENAYLGGLFGSVWLCDEHRTPETVREIRPFKGGYRLIHS